MIVCGSPHFQGFSSVVAPWGLGERPVHRQASFSRSYGNRTTATAFRTSQAENGGKVYKIFL